jgi:hypothetical protein
VVAFFYSLRTAALPFLFIFNTDLLLIDVTWMQGIFIFVAATIAMLLIAAATQGYFLVRSRIWESALLLFIAFTIFRPGYWMDKAFPPYEDMAPGNIAQAAKATPKGEPLRLRIKGTNEVGQPMEKVVELQLPPGEPTGEGRLKKAGLTLKKDGARIMVDEVAFGSQAKKVGLDWDQEIIQVRVAADTPSKYWMYIPAFLLLGILVWLQRRRLTHSPAPRSEPDSTLAGG